jgi:hypothetical protein
MENRMVPLVGSVIRCLIHLAVEFVDRFRVLAQASVNSAVDLPRSIA